MRAPSVRIVSPVRRWPGKSTSCFEPGASATARRTRSSRSFRSTCVQGFRRNHDGNLSVEAPCSPVARPDERLTDQPPREQLAVRAHHRLPQLVQPRPGSLIRSQAQHVAGSAPAHRSSARSPNRSQTTCSTAYACGERSSSGGLSGTYQEFRAWFHGGASCSCRFARRVHHAALSSSYAVGLTRCPHRVVSLCPLSAATASPQRSPV